MLRAVFLSVVFLILSPVSLLAGEVSVSEVKAGFDGYYRPGYWCPLKIRLKAPDAFSGCVEIIIDHVKYKHYFDLPAGSSGSVFLPVFIPSYLRKLDFGIYSLGGDKVTEFAFPLKPLGEDEFLIGVEEQFFHFFKTEFSLYSEASKRTRFFSFSPDELYQDYRILGSIDLLVGSGENLSSANIKKTLTLWQKGLGGNFLVLHSPEVNLSDLSRLSRNRNSFYPSEGVFGLFERVSSGNDTFYRNFFVCYFFFILAAFVFSFWAKKRKAVLVVTVLIILNGLCIVLVLCESPQGAVLENAKIMTLLGDDNLVREDSFAGINILGSEKVFLDLDDMFVLPFCDKKNGESLNCSTAIEKNNHGVKCVLGGADGKLNRFVVVSVKVAKSGFSFDFSPKDVSDGLSGYEFTSDIDLEDCFFMDSAGCIYVGDISAGSVKGVDFAEGDSVKWPLFFDGYLAGNTKDINHQRNILKMWYDANFSQVSKTGARYLLGWQKNTDNNLFDYNYPCLWVVILK